MKRIRLATVYKTDEFKEPLGCHMAHIRWSRMSAALSHMGFSVDEIRNGSREIIQRGPHWRWVPFSATKWEEYDIIKTLYQRGYETLAAQGVSRHPFLLSRLASVVTDTDGQAGVHFYGEERQGLYETQIRIARDARWVSFSTDQNRSLWQARFGNPKKTLLVPSATDRFVPGPGRNPYREFPERIALYAGHLYSTTQREVNVDWQKRLNDLGRRLKSKNIRLCLVGSGRVDLINPSYVTYLGEVGHDHFWDYQYFAHVGIVLAQGQLQNNDSSKIYYYLRTGLPVVSEEPVPNNHLIEETGHGFIAPYGATEILADMIEDAIHSAWKPDDVIPFILANHTWRERAKIYAAAMAEYFDLPQPSQRTTTATGSTR